eukprot:TRINITY_DN10417_c0_g1_i4.p1 TRINITY_DN10417_c0_g1~~TRINITY_DN10417_c0_g1_i4.p1  ORF type:complete len:1130 (-),score=181.88 TRINITY_DN10417_c0_g1_i4:249-3638(-)
MFGLTEHSIVPMAVNAMLLVFKVCRDLITEMGTELLLGFLFCTGFGMCRVAAIRRLFGGRKLKSGLMHGIKQGGAGQFSSHPLSENSPCQRAKQLEANWGADRADLVLRDWPCASDGNPMETFSVGALKAVVEVLVSVGRVADVPTVLSRLVGLHSSVRTQEAFAAASEAIASAESDEQKRMKVLAELRDLFRESFQGSDSSQIMSASHGAAAPSKAEPLDQPESFHRQPVTPSTRLSQEARTNLRGIRVALNAKNIDTATQLLLATAAKGYAVPPGCVVAVLRMAKELGNGGVVKAIITGQGILTLDTLPGLMEFAARSGDASLLRDVQARACAVGVTLSVSVRQALLCGLANSGDASAVEVIDELALAARGPVLPESSIVSVVYACVESRHFHLAERCVQLVRQAHGKVSLSLYAALMKVYSHARFFDRVCDLYDSMRRDAVQPDDSAHGALIRAAVECGRLELARELFHKSGNPDLLNYMSLIRAAGRERNVEKALQLLNDLEESPLSLDATAYNCVLDVCAACGDRTAASSLLARMDARSCVDVISYNTYLKILLAEGAREDVSGVIQHMRERAVNPNIVTYNSMVKGFVEHKDLAKAWHLVEEMERDGVIPDSFTCSILLKGSRHTTSPHEVDKVLALVARAKISPDEVLVNCLLDACVRLRDADRLAMILDQFRSTGVVPSPHARAMLIRAYGHARRPDRAWALWREATGGGSIVGDSVDEEVFASMVEACLAGGDLSGAAAVLRQCHPRLKAFHRAPGIFMAFVKACAQNKRSRLAVDLYGEVKDSIVCTNVTYNTLIDSLTRQDDMARATELFRDMSIQGVTPDLITYSTLIRGHCSRGDLEQGIKLLGVMQRRGIAPDVVLFNSILDGCAHKQMRALTEQVLGDMESANVAPSNFTLSILVKLYGRCGDLDEAFRVVEAYPKTFGFRLNAQVYTCLMSACIVAGDQSRAFEVYDTMLRDGLKADTKTCRTMLSGCLRHGDVNGAIRIVEDALQQSGCVSPGVNAGSSCYAVNDLVALPLLDREALEGVLLMSVRQGRTSDVGLPLLKRLQAVGVCISQRVVDAVCGRREVRGRVQCSGNALAVVNSAAGSVRVAAPDVQCGRPEILTSASLNGGDSVAVC